MRIVEVNKYSDFLALEGTWQDVLQECNYHTIFSTWEWLTTWWKHFGQKRRLLLLLVDENNRTIGIAPLMYSIHTMFGLRQGKIEFISAPDADYNDFILAAKNEESTRLFVNHLNNLSEKWSCIELMDVPDSSPSIGLLKKTSKKTRRDHICPYVHLPRSYEVLFENLGRKHRKNLRRNLRLLEKDFTVDFSDNSKATSVDSGMNAFFELHQRRWKSKGSAGVFFDERLRNFHLDIAKIFAQRGWLRLFLLKLSGRPVAAHYGFSYGSRFYSYLSGFDPRYSRYGVGDLLTAHAISSCINEGLEGFDFMRGAEEYKERWNAIKRWNRTVIIPRKNFLGNFRSSLYEEYWRQGRRLKYVLRIAQ